MESSTGRALVIYNPTAGTVVDIDICLGAVIHNLCKVRGLSVTVRPTAPNQARKETADLIDGTYDLIVAAGGDGTIRLVLGAAADKAPDTPVALIPLGTGNQLARNLKIFEESILTDTVEDAIAVMLNGHPQVIDLGLMNDEYFCVAAGAGPISDAIISPSRQEKANFKMFAYVSSMIQNLASPPVVFRVKTGTDDFHVSASGIFITNCGDLGVGTLSDTAELNDGLLDLCIMNPNEFTDYLQLGFHFTASGLGGDVPPYYIRKVTSVDLEVVPVQSRLSDFQAMAHKVRTALRGAEEAPPVYQQVTAMVDGDPFGTTPMSIKIVPHAVKVLTP